MEFELAPPKEIAIVGEQAEHLLAVVFGEYRPNQVVAYAVGDEGSVIPLLKERGAEGSKATVYVCQHFACQMPVTEALAAQLTR